MSALQLIQFQSRGLRAFDLTLAAGECVSLAGPSGSGKSLLLRAIADLDPHGGDAMIGQRLLSQTPAPQWRSLVGLLPAESQWWDERVGQHMHGIDRQSLQQLGFDEHCLEWEIARLSSGERQRLALLRLLSGRPEALLLDEPTANLDEQSGRQVEQLITEYRRGGGAVLWVSHDPQQCRRVAERGLTIDNQQLRELQWT